ncbi:MAG: hypothetical protein GX854_04300 [Clostridiales bacterium]|nr:hypothetical protein [Clostridiales bacterium]
MQGLNACKSNNIYRRLLIIISVMIYIIVLMNNYRVTYTPGEAGGNYPTFVFILSFFIVLLPSLWLPVSITRPTQVTYWILYLLVVVPSSTIPFYVLTMEPERLILLPISLVSVFAVLGLIYTVPVIRLPHIKTNTLLFWVVIAVIILILFFIAIKAFGLPRDIPGLSNIYNVRSEYVESLKNLSSDSDISHIVRWLLYIFNPLLIAYGLIKRRIIYLGLGLLGQLYIYSISGFKSALFFILIALGVLFAMNFKAKYFGLLITNGLNLLVIFSILLFNLFDNNKLWHIFVRRLLFVTGVNTGYYYDYFASHPFVFMGSNRILGYLVDYVRTYELGIPFLIAQEYYGRLFSANANLWADAFANYGFCGLFIYTVALALLMYLYDSLCEGKNIYLCCLLLVGPTFALCNSSLLTTFIGHGAFWLLIIAFLIPKNKLSYLRKGYSSGN